MIKLSQDFITGFIIIFISSFIIFAVIYYDNAIKCEIANGDWHMNKCWNKYNNEEIEL